MNTEGNLRVLLNFNWKYISLYMRNRTATAGGGERECNFIILFFDSMREKKFPVRLRVDFW